MSLLTDMSSSMKNILLDELVEPCFRACALVSLATTRRFFSMSMSFKERASGILTALQNTIRE